MARSTQNARAVSEAFVNTQFTSTGPEALSAETREELVDLLARATPLLSAQGFTIILALYLWARRPASSRSRSGCRVPGLRCRNSSCRAPPG